MNNNTKYTLQYNWYNYLLPYSCVFLELYTTGGTSHDSILLCVPRAPYQYHTTYIINKRVIDTLHPLCLGAFSIWSQTIFFGSMHPKV